MRGLVLFIFVMISFHLQSQSLSGYVTDTDQFPLVGANVYLPELGRGTNTNEEGFFTIEDLEEGSFSIEVSFVGYKSTKQRVSISANLEDIDYLNFVLKGSAEFLDELIISSLRTKAEEPFSYSDVSEDFIAERNLGQDIPFLFNHTPSVVVTSDAGAGVGYSGIRIRGSDPTRINVTINGIPYNDSESQGVFWVNMPDFASSMDDVQIQRGIGTSTNGSGAFGGSINIGTLDSNKDPYGVLSNSLGSFGTRKHTLALGTGLLDKKFTFEGRLSLIKSNGYIDRAASDLRSYYMSAGYYHTNTTVKAITFSGKERTYQSWYGTPQSRVDNDIEAMKLHAANNGYTNEQTDNLLNSGRTYNFYLYENEIDNYGQDHYQLHVSHETRSGLTLSSAIHYTKGGGYFEQFKQDDDLEDYGLSAQTIGVETISSTDLIRRRWLDNDYYGMVFNIGKYNENYTLDVGGGIHQYDGGHFGEIIWARATNNYDIRHRYYDNIGNKSEYNIYTKLNYNLAENLSLYGDLQMRGVGYDVEGIDNDQRMLSTKDDLNFFNPKFGVTYNLTSNSQLYLSYARGSREPDRNDYIDAPEGKDPLPEKMNNVEFGWRKKGALDLSANAYLMQYKDQLVLTGALNDVGSSTRINVPKSFRLGLELAGVYQLSNGIGWSANLTLSRNKINSFSEVVYDYTNGFDIIENSFNDTDISFSPTVIGSNIFSYTLENDLRISLQSKYVGKQYLDNTSNDARAIDAFFVNDLLAEYSLPIKGLKSVKLNLQVNNLLDSKYASNGYSFNYVFGDLITENFYYPQAGINYLIGLTMKF